MNHIIANKVYNGHGLYRVDDPYNPYNLPPYTIRMRFNYTGYTPTFQKGVGVQVSQSPNIWDLTYENSDWSYLFNSISPDYLSEIIGANTTNVTNMHGMFFNQYNLTGTPLFNTNNVTDIGSMFENCRSLKEITLYDTSKVTNAQSTFGFCYYVSAGILDMYNQLSTQENVPTLYGGCFQYCGVSSQVGSAELAQIPSDWK